MRLQRCGKAQNELLAGRYVGYSGIATLRVAYPGGSVDARAKWRKPCPGVEWALGADSHICVTIWDRLRLVVVWSG
jgi:hypothetical protein